MRNLKLGMGLTSTHRQEFPKSYALAGLGCGATPCNSENTDNTYKILKKGFFLGALVTLSVLYIIGK